MSMKNLLKQIKKELEQYMMYPACLECQMDACMKCKHKELCEHSKLYDEIRKYVDSDSDSDTDSDDTVTDGNSSDSDSSDSDSDSDSNSDDE